MHTISDWGRMGYSLCTDLPMFVHAYILSFNVFRNANIVVNKKLCTNLYMVIIV